MYLLPTKELSNSMLLQMPLFDLIDSLVPSTAKTFNFQQKDYVHTEQIS